MNDVIWVASSHGRDYITPEDISEASKRSDKTPDELRMDVLEVMSGLTKFGVEDRQLCAFTAHELY